MKKGELRSLSEREQARDKVSVFFGSRDNFYHPFIEIVLNSVDEIRNNFESGNIKVKLFEDGETISVTDTGRGLPLLGKTDGVENYKLLLLKLFAGTNYDNNEIGKITTGTNGVGLTVTNYCSEMLEATSIRDGKMTTITFEDGGKVKSIVTKDCIGNSSTKIKFKLDKQIFTSLKYDVEEQKSILKRISGVSNKVNITYEHNDEIVNYHYDSIAEYFEEVSLTRTSSSVMGPMKEYKDVISCVVRDHVPLEQTGDRIEKKELNKMQLILATAVEPLQESFLNVTFLKERGTIDDGIIEGVRETVNKYCKDKKKFTNKNDNITSKDVEESVTYVCNFLSTNVEFANQTKFSTQKALYKKIAKKYTKELLEVHMTEQPQEFEKFVQHILDIHEFNNKSSSKRKALQKKLSEKIDDFAKVEGLVDCRNHGENAEIFICEGKSALGSVILARNPEFQAGVAIRGKIMNCLKASLDEILNSPIVPDLIKILGCGIETSRKNKDLGEFKLENLRYGKIIIATDMDPDGYQIACLLLTLFYRLTPKLIENGMVYIALTPLFEITDLITKQVHYAFSEEEKQEIINKLTKYKVSRNKGLGELNANVMSETGVNPETRTIVQVTMNDVKEMEKAFQIWMDEDVTERKNIIMHELDKYTDID